MSNSSATLVKQERVVQTKTPIKPPPLLAKALRTAVWTSLSLAAAIAVTEGVFAIAHIGEEEFVDIHPTIGFWHMPNKLVTWRSEGYSQSTTSGDGLRDIDFPLQKPAGTKRIMVTGDSMVEGYQVAPDQTFVQQLSNRLNKDGLKTEGMNFGMSGFSTVQALYLFKEKMLRYQPDVVILAYHVGDNEKNEYSPAPGGFMPRPHARMTDDGHLQTDWQGYDIWMDGPMHKQYEATRWLRAHSRIWGVLTKLELQMSDLKWYKQLKAMLDKKTASAPKPQPRFTSTENDFGLQDGQFDTNFAALPKPTAGIQYTPISDKLTKEQVKEVQAVRDIAAGWRMIMSNGNRRFAMTGALIDVLNRACKKAHCRLVVAGLPAPSNSLLYKRELHMMEKLAWTSGFTFVDLNAEFPAIAPMQANDFYYNVHFTPRGHELVTNILYKHFKQTGLVEQLRSSP